jgi:hypothetical protein
MAPRRCLGRRPTRKLPALRAVARQVEERAEVDLAVSGLKPDWPQGPRPLVSRRRALSAGSCVAAGVGVTAAAGRTPDLLQARRRTSVRTNQNRPAHSAFFFERPTIGPRRVRSQSDPTQTHKPTAHAKKACKYRPFSKRHGHAGARRAGAQRRTTNTGRWLRPVRLGIGASNCVMRSAPSSSSYGVPSRSCARSSIRRTRRSEVADSAIRTQARHSGSSPKPGPGAAVAF